jgi:RND family efflux transporter MFP subunit
MMLIFLPFWLYGVEISGYVISDDTVVISTRNTGLVEQIYVKEGSKTKKGDLLISIDSKDMDVMLQQAKLAKNQAKLSLQMHMNNYKDVQLNYQRHKRLYELDVVSKYELEQVELAKKNLEALIEIAKAQVTQADEQIKRIKNQYNYLNIKAPKDGVIVQKNIEVGQLALAGMPLFVLSDIDNLIIEVEVSESNLDGLFEGMAVKVSIPSAKLNSNGTIKTIIPNANRLNHSFKVKIEFDYKGKRVYPGMYATVKWDR